MHPGDILGHRYRLIELIGGGGMGDVWRAADTLLERDVAIKILRRSLSDSDRFREQFRREALMTAAIRHQCVVDIHDYSEDRDGDALIAFLVMEYVDGQPLSAILRSRELGIEDTMDLVGSVAEALHEAHGAGIVHRDVKPGNILVRDDDSVVLVDFGIAHIPDAAEDRPESDATVQGTASYMSPEQLRDNPLTPASDIYSLGVVAYECLTGYPPFRAEDPADVRRGHLFELPPPLPDDIPPAVNALVTRALEKEPDDRFPSAAAMATDCRNINHATAVLAPLLAVLPSRDEKDEAPEPAADTAPAEPEPEPDSPALRPAATASVAPPEPPVPPHLDSEPTAPQPAPRKRRHLLRALTIAVIVAVAVTLLWTRVWEPGSHATADPGDDSGSSVVDGPATTAGGTPGAPESADGSGSQTADPSGSDAESGSDTPGGHHPSSGSHDDPTTPGGDPSSSTGSHTPSVDPTVEVPNVVGMPRDAAERALADDGFNVNVDEKGHGDVSCAVSEQTPGGGTDSTPGSTVTITVRMAPNENACEEDGYDDPPE